MTARQSSACAQKIAATLVLPSIALTPETTVTPGDLQRVGVLLTREQGGALRRVA